MVTEGWWSLQCWGKDILEGRHGASIGQTSDRVVEFFRGECLRLHQGDSEVGRTNFKVHPRCPTAIAISQPQFALNPRGEL